jgi:hypothetical protein
MNEKNLRKDGASHILPQAAKTALLSLVILAFALNASAANSFCDSLITSPNLPPILGSGSAGFQGILLASIVIILIMIGVVSILYLFGYAFRIDKLLRFSKTEIGEIAVTVIVVLVFLGSFYLINGIASNNLFSLGNINGGLNSGIFYSDCNNLSTAGTNILSQLWGLMISQQTIAFMSSLNFHFMTTYWGLSNVVPLSGLSLISYSLIGTMVTITGAVFSVLFVLAAIIGIFYVLFPIFLFVGIILRSFPWTRAAGGAFLGLFIGFYIMFPLLVYMLISVSAVQPNPGIPISSVSSGFDIGAGDVNSLTSFFSQGAIQIMNQTYDFITIVIGQSFYLIMAAVLSFMISYDFTETMGDFLGSPSLSSKNVLKKLV